MRSSGSVPPAQRQLSGILNAIAKTQVENCRTGRYDRVSNPVANKAKRSARTRNQVHR